MTRKLGTAINNNFDNAEMTINSRLPFGNNGDNDFHSGDLNKLVDLINPEIQLESTSQVDGLDDALDDKQPLNANLTNLSNLSSATFGGNLSFANAFSTVGNFAVVHTYTAPTNVTYPTSGTLATTSQLPTPAALTKTDDTNVTATLTGVPTSALLQTVNIAFGWSGQLAVARGGTGLASTTAYGLIAGGTTNTGNLQNVGTGASGTILQGNGVSALPTFSTATYPSTTTANRILYSSSNNVIGQIATVASGVLVTDASGVPSISNTIPNASLNISNRTVIASATLAATDNGGIVYCNSATAITITLPKQTTAALSAGFNCRIININFGDVTVTHEAGDIFESPTLLIAQNAEMEVILQTAGTPNTWLGNGGTLLVGDQYTVKFDGTAANGTYIACGYLPADCTVIGAKFGCTSGSGTATCNLNAVNITNGALSVTSTTSTQSFTGNNTGSAGQILQVTLSAVASLTNAWITFIVTRRF
jgi:hypothetical protein